jgi:hypothetical protein
MPSRSSVTARGGKPPVGERGRDEGHGQEPSPAPRPSAAAAWSSARMGTYRKHQPAASSAAGASPVIRPLAYPNNPPETGSCRTRQPRVLSPDVTIRADGIHPGPVMPRV